MPPSSADVFAGVPRLPDHYLPRERLFAALDRGAPLTICSAPAGAGKTTLVAAWVRSRLDPERETLVWTSAGDGGQDRLELFRIGLRAAVAVGLVDRDAAASVLGGVGGAIDPGRVVDLFVDGVRRHDRPIVWVLDGSRTVDPEYERGWREAFRMLSRLPGMRIIVTTRRPNFTNRTAASSPVETVFVTPEELAFTAEEAAELLAAWDVTPVDARVSLGVLADIGGNAHLLRVGARVLARDGVRSYGGAEDFFAAWRAAVADAVPLDELDRTTLGVLRAVLSVPRCGAPLATRLAGTDEPGALAAFDDLDRLGVGVWERGWRGAAQYRVLPFVRDALAEALVGVAGVPELVIDPVDALLEFGNADAAVRVAAERGDLVTTGRLVRRHWDELRGTTIEALAAQLWAVDPRNLVDVPELFMLAAGGVNSTDPLRVERATETLRLALETARRRRPSAPTAWLAFLYDAILAATGRMLGEPQVAQRGLASAEGSFRAMRDEDVAELRGILPGMLGHLGVTALGGIDPFVARRWFEEGVAVAERTGQRSSAALLSEAIRTILAMIGSMREAARIDDDPDAPRADEQMPQLRRFADVGRGLVLLEEMRLEEARDHLLALQAAGDPTAARWWYPLPWLMLARLGLGEAEQEAQRLARRLPTRQPMPMFESAQRYVDNLHAVLWIAAGRLGEADRVIAAHRGSCELSAAAALRALVTGDAEEALRIVVRHGDASPLRPRSDASVHLIGAAAAHAAGHRAAARRLLALTVDFDHDYGALTPWLLLPGAFRVALRDFAAAEGDDRAVALLERVIAVVPDVVPDRLASTDLSAVESEVLRELFMGGSLAEIAQRRFVSENTVKSQVRAIYRKLGASGREDAIRRAIEEGLV